MTSEQIADALEDDMGDEEFEEYDSRMWAQAWWQEQLRRDQEGR